MVSNPHGNQKEDIYRIYTQGNEKGIKHVTTKKNNWTQTKAIMDDMRDKKLWDIWKDSNLTEETLPLSVIALNINGLKFLHSEGIN